MKILTLLHGYIDYPPTGWGAVETTTAQWEKYIKRAGHEHFVTNTKNHEHIRQRVAELKPDVIHCKNRDWSALLESLDAPVKIMGIHDGDFYANTPAQKEIHKRIYKQEFGQCSFYIHCISWDIRTILMNNGIDFSRLFVANNGTDAEEMAFDPMAKNPYTTVFLARNQPRKRLDLVKHISNLVIAGPGYPAGQGVEWSRKYVNNTLTQYGNLVLLSESEGAPRVVEEALMAGLGVVVSQNASYGLTGLHPWIDIIPESLVTNTEYVRIIVERNRQITRLFRQDIRDYAEDRFSTEKIVNNYLQFLEQAMPAEHCEQE